jgi:hypothetical protein
MGMELVGRSIKAHRSKAKFLSTYSSQILLFGAEVRQTTLGRPERDSLFKRVSLAVLMRFKHIASFIVNANHEWVRAGVRLRLTHGGSSVDEAATAPQWQHI